MQSLERDQGRADSSAPSTEEDRALREAEATAARMGEDEEAANEARERFRTEPIPTIEPDEAVRDHLAETEVLHSVRPSSLIGPPADDRALGYGGTLYLTSHRLLLIGQVAINVQLGDIVETSIAGSRLLVTLRNGEGLTLDVHRPQLFRTEIAAVMRGLRR